MINTLKEKIIDRSSKLEAGGGLVDLIDPDAVHLGYPEERQLWQKQKISRFVCDTNKSDGIDYIDDDASRLSLVMNIKEASLNRKQQPKYFQFSLSIFKQCLIFK